MFYIYIFRRYRYRYVLIWYTYNYWRVLFMLCWHKRQIEWNLKCKKVLKNKQYPVFLFNSFILLQCKKKKSIIYFLKNWRYYILLRKPLLHLLHEYVCINCPGFKTIFGSYFFLILCPMKCDIRSCASYCPIRSVVLTALWRASCHGGRAKKFQTIIFCRNYRALNEIKDYFKSSQWTGKLNCNSLSQLNSTNTDLLA